jgi:hypothetical protein
MRSEMAADLWLLLEAQRPLPLQGVGSQNWFHADQCLHDCSLHDTRCCCNCCLLLQVMRFDVLSTPPTNGLFDATKRATLDAALRAEYGKAPTALPAAPSRTRQVTSSRQQPT